MNKTIIIAEAGVNHNGDLELARQLIDAAADAGVDYVKFQTFKAEKLVTRTAQQAEYQAQNAAEEDGSQFAMLKKLELSEADHYQLRDYAESCGVKFLSTPFDLESIDFLHSMGLDLWKIPSGEISNYPYLRKIAGYNQRVVMSTGMCNEQDVAAALKVLSDNGQDLEKVTLLHCNTQYPTPMRDVNLRAMDTLRKFVKSVGFSDHTAGIEVPVAAVAMGAEVIEKHFTLSKALPGPDHKASLEPLELKQMVQMIRNVEQAMGSPRKCITESESANRAVARKSIVALRPIRKGEVLDETNIGCKRPGTGLSPMSWPEVEGTLAIRDFAPDELIEIRDKR